MDVGACVMGVMNAAADKHGASDMKLKSCYHNQTSPTKRRRACW